MTRSLAPYATLQFFDRNGKPLAGGKLYSYIAGTTTPKPTYTSSTGGENDNPFILDDHGRGAVWLDNSVSYKLILKDAADVVIWTVDNITDWGGSIGSGGTVLAGDATGTVTANTVEKIQGIAVSATDPTAEQALIYRSGSWTPGAVDLDASGSVSGILPSAFGGTGNGFTKFSGPTTSEKTFTLPDASGTIATILTGTATLDFPSTNTLLSADLTITVTGAAVGDPVALGTPAAPAANTCFTAHVSATDTVTVRFNNYSSGTIDPASGTFKVKVFK
jgi:hypothetical protein